MLRPFVLGLPDHVARLELAPLGFEVAPEGRGRDMRTPVARIPPV